jgi:hypothetical protein
MTFDYRVSLQVFHPSADPADIARRLGRPAVRSWSVGESRHTPVGTPLPGAYRETYCAFDIAQGEDGELARCLSAAVADLQDATSLFHELRASGGRANFYVSWTTGERGEIFSTDLLSSIAELGVDLGIEPLSAM